MICKTCKCQISKKTHSDRSAFFWIYLLNSRSHEEFKDDRLAFLVCQVNKKKRQKFDGRASQSEIAKRTINKYYRIAENYIHKTVQILSE